MNDRFKFKGYWYNDTLKEWRVYNEPEFITGDGSAEIWYDTEGGACPELPPNADLHLCQSTGLKDKNGKLIYEGDILGGIYHGYIEYCDECKCFQLKVKDYGCLACEGDLHWYELVEAEEQNELEVIGNIYENKSLLESEG